MELFSGLWQQCLVRALGCLPNKMSSIWRVSLSLSRPLQRPLHAPISSLSLALAWFLGRVLSLQSSLLATLGGNVELGKLKRGRVPCERFDRTLSVVLKILSPGFYRPFSETKCGFDRTSIKPF